MYYYEKNLEKPLIVGLTSVRNPTLTSSSFPCKTSFTHFIVHGILNGVFTILHCFHILKELPSSIQSVQIFSKTLLLHIERHWNKSTKEAFHHLWPLSSPQWWCTSLRELTRHPHFLRGQQKQSIKKKTWSLAYCEGMHDNCWM